MHYQQDCPPPLTQCLQANPSSQKESPLLETDPNVCEHVIGQSMMSQA